MIKTVTLSPVRLVTIGTLFRLMQWDFSCSKLVASYSLANFLTLSKLLRTCFCVYVHYGNLSLYVAKFTNNEMSHISTYFPIGLIMSEH